MMLCNAAFCHAMLCHAMFYCVFVMLCSVVLCPVQFCHVRRKRGGRDSQGFSGDLGIWRPRYARWAGREVYSENLTIPTCRAGNKINEIETQGALLEQYWTIAGLS